MSEAAAPTVATTPAAPAATATEAPTAAATATMLAAPPDAGATTKQDAKASGRQRARDLAGKFLQGGRDMPGPDAAAPKAEAEAASTEVAKAAEPEKAAEAAKPDPKDDAAEKQWREIRRRKRAAREQQAQLAADRATVATEKQRLEALRAEQVADAELKQKDPPAWLEKHNFDFRDVALREVQKQQLTPEQKAAKDELDAIRAELAAERAAREKDAKDSSDLFNEYKAERAAKAAKDALEKVHADAASEWTQAKPEFPTLAAYYTQDEIIETSTKLRVDHYNKTTKRDASGKVIAHGQDIPLDEVFAFMETNAAREHQRFSRQQAQAAAERAERDTAATSVAKTRAKVGPPVTNQVAATRASPEKPLTEADKRARAVAKAAELMGPRH